MVYLAPQLEDVVIEEFDGILPKLGIVNLENIPKHVDFVEDWQCLIWAEGLFHWTPIFEKYVIGMDIKEDTQKTCV
jgi:hypothetical protein